MTESARPLGRAAILCTLCALPVTADAQIARPSGDATIMGDLFPNRGNTAELRARLFAEEKVDAGGLRVTVSGFAEGLLRRCSPCTAGAGPGAGRLDPTGDKTSEDAVLQFLDAKVEYRTARLDLLAGLARVSWGRLDELQPTDVVNPLDVSRFFLDGRSEARLPVAMLRARVFISDDIALEGIVVPFFRPGRFDQLDEPTSPFNVEPAFVPPFAVERDEPSNTLSNLQAGGRFSATTGRVDWSLSAFRGFEPFGFGELLPPTPRAGSIVVRISHPRFTMVGGDFETVRGKWGVRGEAAVFVDDNFQHPALRMVRGSSADAGLGVDRKAGDYRISGTVVLHHESYDEPMDEGEGPDSGRFDMSLVLSSDRSFGRDRYNLRVFGVYNPVESSSFLRAIARAALRDNLSLEGSAGWFAADGRDLVGRFGDSDFVYARLKYYF